MRALGQAWGPWASLWAIALRLALRLAVLCLCACPIAPKAPVAHGAFAPDDMTKYLMRFGYLPEIDFEKPNLRSADERTHAIKELQRFAGLPVTGVVDKNTENLMRRSRCGRPDVDEDPEERARRHHHGRGRGHGGRRRVRRYAVRNSWDKTEISWRLKTDVPPGLDKTRVRQELQAALDLWARPSKLRFPENDTSAMIEVSFERWFHGDNFPFDGKGLILAHAFFPGSGLGGDVHFDGDEKWVLQNDVRVGKDEGTSIFAVAAHEFGHSLGLMHSSVSGSLMNPWYKGLPAGYQLPDDDTHAIQQLYGSREDRLWARMPEYRPEESPPPPPREPVQPASPRRPPRPHGPPWPPSTSQPPMADPVPPRKPYQPRHDPKKPDTCNTAYDAVAVIRRELFVFKGKYIWRIGDHGLLPGYPAEIDRLWYGLPKNFTHIDAVYERFDKKIVFFIGKEYFIFSANHIDRDYPQPLTKLGLPSSLTHIDGAMVWGYNGKTYLFSGTYYWRLDEEEGTVELDYPRDMSIWRGVGYNIDAVFQWKDGVTYFFKGKGYWKFNDLQMRVEHKIPKNSASFWMRCPEPEGRWLDWEENSIDIYNDIEASFYDQHIDYDDAGSSVTVTYLVLWISLSSSIYYAL